MQEYASLEKADTMSNSAGPFTDPREGLQCATALIGQLKTNRLSQVKWNSVYVNHPLYHTCMYRKVKL